MRPGQFLTVLEGIANHLLQVGKDAGLQDLIFNGRVGLDVHGWDLDAGWAITELRDALIDDMAMRSPIQLDYSPDRPPKPDHHDPDANYEAELEFADEVASHILNMAVKSMGKVVEFQHERHRDIHYFAILHPNEQQSNVIRLFKSQRTK